jgi:hypothetical protein
MKNEMKIFIPFLCYCCSKGSIQISDRAFKKFNTINKKELINIDLVKDLFSENQSELFNPEKFWLTISNVFKLIHNSYTDIESQLVINAIKRIISLSAHEFNLPEFKFENITQLLISDYDKWFDFMDNLITNVMFMDAIIYVQYSKSREIAYCAVGLEDNTLVQVTEVMISQITDYWKIQHFKK